MILFMLTSWFMSPDATIVDFNTTSNLRNWYTVDDVVMGGRSNGDFYINEEGHGVFTGTVSLENNGGFSSLRYALSSKDVSSFNTISLRLKGDGKAYQLRVKSDRRERVSYTYTFQTSGEWQWVNIPMEDMVPTWRGMRLNYPNFPAQSLEEIGILIGNKKPESFTLVIDEIRLKSDAYVMTSL